MHLQLIIHKNAGISYFIFTCTFALHKCTKLGWIPPYHEAVLLYPASVGPMAWWLRALHDVFLFLSRRSSDREFNPAPGHMFFLSLLFADL